MYNGSKFIEFPGLEKYLKPLWFIGSVYYDKESEKTYANISSIIPLNFDRNNKIIFELENGKWIPSNILEEINQVTYLQTGEIIREFTHTSSIFTNKSKFFPKSLIFFTTGMTQSSKDPDQYFTKENGLWKKYDSFQGVIIKDLRKGLLIQTSKGIGLYNPNYSKMFTEEEGLLSRKGKSPLSLPG